MSNNSITVQGSNVAVNDVLTFMKITSSYHNAQRFVVMNEVIRDHAKHEDLHIDDNVLQTYSDLKRLEFGLHSNSDINSYLEGLGVSVDDWEYALENELYRQDLRNRFGANLFLVDAWRLVQAIPEVRNALTQTYLNKAKEHGVEVNENDLQEASDNFRRVVGLHDAEEFAKVLEGLRMDEDDWSNYVEANISLRKMIDEDKDHNFTNEVKSILAKYPIVESLLSDYVYGKIIHAKAKKEKITVSDAELQEFIDNFRRALKFHNVNTFNVWLSATGLALEEFEYLAETEIIKKKMAEKKVELFDTESIQKSIKISKFFYDAAQKVRVLNLAHEHADKEGIKVNDDDLNHESEVLRRVFNLHNSDEFKAYLENHEIDVDQWEWYCEKSATLRKLFEAKVNNDLIQEYLGKDQELRRVVENRVFNDYLNNI